MTDDDMLLGRQVQGPNRYTPELLYPIPREQSRAELGLRGSALPFHGEDIWHAYELSWLQDKGRPVVRLGRIHVPAQSPNLVESKSLKLYLNSLNSTEFANQNEAATTITNDLSAVVGADVRLQLFRLDDPEFAGGALPGTCLDDETLSAEPADGPRLCSSGDTAEESLYTHLLRSLCPVTGQPDWATVWLTYKGPRIDRASLLSYFIGFREHQEFHEQCVERMYMGIMAACEPDRLEIQALYTRRGGLDISPWRSSEPGSAPTLRLNRQ
ncbi:MAG: NADPH-dependent 7-cyano-7-deazaguanine reductase QueF [Halieaceae bacterium]